MTEEYRPAVRAMGDVAPDTQAGGDVRTLLSPKSVGCTTGFMGCATIAPGDWIAEHYHPFSEEFVFVVSGTLVAELDGEPSEVPAQHAACSSRSTASTACGTSATRTRSSSSISARSHRGRRWGTSTPSIEPPTRPRPQHPEPGSQVRRSVVTGVGVVAPGGSTRDAFWETITAGRTATGKITFFDPSGFRSQIAAECDFDPVEAGLDHQEIRRMDRYVQFAVAAAMEAMRDSGLDLEAVDRERMGVTLGTAVGGTMFLEDDYIAVSNKGEEWLVDPEYARPFLFQALMPSSLASEVALKFGAQGPSTVISTGCTSGHRRDRLRPPADPGRRGRHRHRRCVGVGHLPHLDGLLRPDQGDVAPQRHARAGVAAVRPRPRRLRHGRGRRDPDPGGVRERDGARRARLLRGGRLREPRQRVPHDRPRPDGLEMADAITDAMRQGGLVPEDIGYINAHGSGTKQNDRHETAAYKLSLGEQAYKIPVSSIKSMVGHSLGGIGAIEMAACALAIENGRDPADRQLGEPGSRVRSRLHARRSRAGRRSTQRCRRAAASAASSRRSSSRGRRS